MSEYSVYLVNAGNDVGMSSIANDGSFPALNVLALGTWLKHKIPEVAVFARDSQVMPIEDILNEIVERKPNLVGVSVLCTSYGNSLKIARTANAVGSKVVFGNDQAAQMAKKILELRQTVDFVVGHEYGELPLEMLVRKLMGENLEFSQIPALAFRDEFGRPQGFFRSNFIIEKNNRPDNPNENLDSDEFVSLAHLNNLNSLSLTSPYSGYAGPLKIAGLNRKNALDLFPVVDYGLYPKGHMDRYLANYLKRFSNLHKETDEVTGVATINLLRGCNRVMSPCAHCDMLLDMSFSSPEKFWNTVKAVHGTTGANCFYEVCDNFSNFLPQINAIVGAKPDDLGFNPMFFVYSQAKDIGGKNGHKILAAFKQLNVFRVNLGLESMNDGVLKYLKGESDSALQNVVALTRLKEAKIATYVSSIVGSEAETNFSLKENVARLCELIDLGLISDIEIQNYLPLLENKGGPHIAALLSGGDWPEDIDELAKQYTNTLSKIQSERGLTPYELCIEAINTVRNHARSSGINFGSGVSDEGNYFLGNNG